MQSKPRKAAVKLEMPADGMALPLIKRGPRHIPAWQLCDWGYRDPAMMRKGVSTSRAVPSRRR